MLFKLKNNSEKAQSIVGIGKFKPGEVKEVSENKKNRLLRNPNFELVEKEQEKTEPAETPKRTTTKK